MRDYESADDDDNPEKPEPPERFIVSDTTTEKLGEILSWSDRGVLGKYDEVAGWIGQMERYHGSGKGASSDRVVWLQAWNGGPYNIDRVKGEMFVNNLSVSILGGIQPARLHEIHGLTSDGLLQRYLPVLMRGASLPLEIDCRKSNKEYEALIHQLIKLRPQRLYLADDTIEVDGCATDAFFPRLRKLASYVLTSLLPLTDLTSDVRDCRGLTVLALKQRISPLVAGGSHPPTPVRPVAFGSSTAPSSTANSPNGRGSRNSASKRSPS